MKSASPEPQKAARPSNPESSQDTLYAARKKLYVRSVTGLFANWRWALVWITISLSGLSAAAPVASSIVSLISPRGATATVGGIVNLTNNLMGVAAPVITGFIVGLTHSFAGAFLVQTSGGELSAIEVK